MVLAGAAPQRGAARGILLRIAGVLHVDAGVVNTVGSAPPWPGRPPWCCQSSKAPSKRNPAGRSPSPPSPEKGCSALVDAAKAVTELERIEYVEDPYLGKGSYCVAERHADGGACSVPDYAVIKLFRHIVQGEGPDTIVREIDEAVRGTNIQSRYEIQFREALRQASRGRTVLSVSHRIYESLGGGTVEIRPQGK